MYVQTGRSHLGVSHPGLNTSKKISTISGACFIRSILLAVLAIQFIISPTSAVWYQVPLKRFLSNTPLRKVSSSTKRSDQVDLHVYRRESASSTGLFDMKNNLNGVSGDGYYIDVNIGTPPQKMQVLIDTGSANFAVAARDDPNIKHYFHPEKSSTFKSDGVDIYVPYTEGEWKGVIGTDVISLPSAQNLSATVNVACITKSKAFFITEADWQGILGLAYSELARPDSSYLPLWDSLTQQQPEVQDVFSLLLCGSSFVHSKGRPLLEGTLIIGGVDPSLAKSPLLYTPIYKQWYYEVVLTDILVDGQSLGMDCKEYNFDKTIVDSGTTNIRLPDKVFSAVVHAIDSNIQGLYVGPYFYSGSDVVCYSDMSLPFSLFPVVSFFLLQSENSSFRLDLTPQHYLRPVENIEDEVSSMQSCVKFGMSSSSSGTVLGAVFMEAFYVVFDRASARIGFGQTTCPLPDPAHPILAQTISGPFSSNKSLQECAYKKPETGGRKLLMVSYILVGLLMVVVFPLLLLLFLWTWRLIRRQNRSRSDTLESQSVLSSP